MTRKYERLPEAERLLSVSGFELRQLADRAHASEQKELATLLHDLARGQEAIEQANHAELLRRMPDADRREGALARMHVRIAATPWPKGAGTGTLTTRQRQVLQAESEGLTLAEAASALHLSLWTARDHHRSALRALDARHGGHAIAIALRHGHIT